MTAERQFSPRVLAQKRPALELRGRVFALVRSFFQQNGYLEVQTPVRVLTPALESHIDAEPSGTRWLRTSPELHMKRMVCAGYEKIFQIGPCFRQGERGDRHLPEYTMLEWYHAGVTSEDLIDETSALFRFLCEGLGRTRFSGLDLAAPPEILHVRDAFQQWAGWDPVAAFDEDRFDLDLVEKVEPQLQKHRVPLIFRDFPAARAALARLRPEDPRVADRWELYLGGMEIANAYTELTDPSEQRHRFEQCARERKARGQAVYPLDEKFLQALEEGMPDCAGIALGMDRLLMILGESQTIDEVVAFTE
ncbi:MAG: EF-P lysine aminoacylase GenX [Verrucomicrobia bacterium]|nr:EF-P lysine aminoacylase GenX [Verrucomicrobiota bacterium]MCH8512739.1 EF-P lysine aminoacylase GenX [Kiritimatiellia bacterium]